MTISLIETAKGTIEYSLRGQGKAVLIVHGGHIDCRETIFQKGINLGQFCFITPSRPGYGNTPLSDINKTPKGTADLLVALLDKLNLQKAIVIGISAGGLTALELAANYPTRVESLVLMSALTQKWFAETDKVYIGGKKLFSPRIEACTWLLYRLSFRLFPQVMARVMFKELSTHRPVQYTGDEFLELKQMTLHMRSGQGFVNDLDQTIDPKTVAQVNCTTLILHSENDNKVSLSHALNASEKIKGSKLITFSNRWGHMLWFGTEYEPVLHELKNFLSDNIRT